MEQLDKTHTIDVEALAHRLLRGQKKSVIFKLPVTQQQGRDIILASYKAEVASRNHAFVETPDLMKHLYAIADVLTDKTNTKPGVFLCGTCGNGKTTFIRALQRAINYMNDYHYLPKYDICDRMCTVGLAMYTAKELLDQYKSSPREFNNRKEEILLAIDDLGEEPTETNIYGNINTPLIELLSHRYDYQLFTMITSNLKPEELSKKYGERINDRLREMCNIVVFNDKSFRI